MIKKHKLTTTGTYDTSNKIRFVLFYVLILQLQKVFRSQGLEKYGEGGDMFDPHLHDAMFAYPDPVQEPGTVGQVTAI